MIETEVEVPCVLLDNWEIYNDEIHFPSIGDTVTITIDNNRIKVTIFFLAGCKSKFKLKIFSEPNSRFGRNKNDSYVGCVVGSDSVKYSLGNLILFTNANICSKKKLKIIT